MTEYAVKLRYGQLRRYEENFYKLINNKRHRPETPPMLERYLSGDEDEPESTIAAASEVPPRSNPYSPPIYSSSGRSVSSAVSDYSSVSARSARSSISTRSSISARSAGSNIPFQGRRRSKPDVADPGTHSKKNIFQCTFCHRSFSNKGGWQRHEETAHIPSSVWICSLDGTVDSSGLCVFCGGEPVLCAHHLGCVHSCAEKDVGARTFMRQDWMEQHIKTVHYRSEANSASGSCIGTEKTLGPRRAKELVKRWKCPQALPKMSSCGFCGETFQDWIARRHHIADHFLSGKTMLEWYGDWGLSPEWMKVLLSGKPVQYNRGSEAVKIVIEGCA
jgi:hypothetical protein